MSKDKKQKINKPENKIFKTLRIIKDIIFGVVLAVLVLTVIVVLTARINGETPTLFGHAVYRVSSGSMEPYLKVGDIILSKECDPMKLKEGDVITYDGKSGQFAGKRVTHRVVKEPYLNENDGKYYLVTKGDDNPAEDTPISVSQVTGKLEAKLDFLNSLYNFFITPWGLLTLIGLIVIAFFNEIIIFVRTLMGYGIEEKREDIQDIIERIQREDAKSKESETASKKENNKQ